MKFSGELQFEDFIQFDNYWQKFFSREIYSTKLFLIVGCVLGLGALIAKDFDFFIGVIFCLTSILITTSVHSAKYSKNYYKKGFETNKIFQEQNDFVIDEEKIEISSKSGNLVLTKELIYRITFDEDSIYVFTGISRTHIIKKRFLQDEAEFAGLISFIKENYAEKIHNIIIKKTSESELMLLILSYGFAAVSLWYAVSEYTSHNGDIAIIATFILFFILCSGLLLCIAGILYKIYGNEPFKCFTKAHKKNTITYFLDRGIFLSDINFWIVTLICASVLRIVMLLDSEPIVVLPATALMLAFMSMFSYLIVSTNRKMALFTEQSEKS